MTVRKKKAPKAAPRPEPLTAPVEDYLKAIYAFERDGRAAATNDIAQRLSIAPASVSGMVQRLADQGLVEYERYRGVRLTTAGRRAALKTIRRHRVIEAYLVRALGYGWDTVHEEAERLEHAVSDTLVDRMAAVLGHPTADPHGDPIPSADGDIHETASVRLSEVGPGSSAELRRVDESQPERLRYIASIGLIPGTVVRVIDCQPFQGPITIQTGGRTHVIAHELAQVLFCAAEDPR